MTGTTQRSDFFMLSSTGRTSFRNSTLFYVLVIVAVACLPRILVHAAYLPWWCGDSGGYLYLNSRTPGYPVVLIIIEHLTGGIVNEQLTPLGASLVMWLQTVVGIASATLIFFLMEMIGFSRKLSLTGALLYCLFPHVAVYEMMVLSETFSLFSILLTLGALTYCLKNTENTDGLYWPALAAGLTASYSILVRPNNLIFFLLFMIGCLTWIGLGKIRASEKWIPAYAKTSTAILLGVSVPILCWMCINLGKTDRFIMTSMIPITRSFAAYNLFDKVPDKDKALGDIMYRYYLKTNADGQVKRDYLWQAMQDIYAHTNEMPYAKKNGYADGVALAEYIGSVSTRLLRQHPRIWLANGLDNFRDTFDFRSPASSPDNTVDPRAVSGGTVVKNVWAFEMLGYMGDVTQYILLSFYVLCWMALPVSFFAAWHDKKNNLLHPIMFSLSAASLASFIAPCFLAAYYQRFAEPIYPVLIILGIYMIHQFWGFFQSTRQRLA